MSENIQTKRCSHCKQIKPISEFNKNHSQKDGYSHRCKICHHKSCKKYDQGEKGRTTRKQYFQSDKGKAKLKRYWQSEKGKIVLQRYQQSKKGKLNQKYYKAYHPERVKAVKAVNNAIRDGKLPQPDTLPCHYCPKLAQQYHHWHGYAPEHWLDVVPVCVKCHGKIPKSN